jgi:hypothetical protein
VIGEGRVGRLPNASILSASIAFYRPQAEISDGANDGKIIATRKEI